MQPLNRERELGTRRWSRRVLPALLGLIASLSLAACASVPPLRVGSDLANPPFASLDANGNPQGRDVEMMKAVAVMLERDLVWVQMPFEQLLPAAQSGAVDIVCATLGRTPERAVHVNFSEPYFLTEITLVVRQGEGEPTLAAQLAGRPVAAGAGSTAERALQRYLPEAVIDTGGPAKASSIARLLAGEVDAAAMDGPAAEAAIAKAPARLRRIESALAAEEYALALPKSHSSLLLALDRALDTLRRGGSQARWNSKFGVTEAAP
ncbi:MAG: substrate-binding periplasmic protein [Planctomycetota bacterium]